MPFNDLWGLLRPRQSPPTQVLQPLLQNGIAPNTLRGGLRTGELNYIAARGNTVDLETRWAPLPQRNDIDWYAEMLMYRQHLGGQLQRQQIEGHTHLGNTRPVIEHQDIMEAYFNGRQFERMYQVHDEYHLYEDARVRALEVAKEEEEMATVKTLKNSISIQGEDDRMDVEFVTRKDGTTCFSITLNDQHVELPVNQTKKLGDFIKSKLSE